MKKRIIGAFFIIGILCITGFTNILTRAGPALQPLKSPDPQIIYMIQQVNESLLYDYNTHLTAIGPRYTGSINCTCAAEYIYTAFNEMGLDVDFHEWHFNRFYSKNIVATLPGTDINSKIEYILCAHYDTVAISPGANDDGSGVAAILAIAKILSQYSFNYTIRFIAFSGEEVGSYGSYLYARNASLRGDNIVAIINLDEIGYAITEEGKQTISILYPKRSEWILDFVTTVNMLYNDETYLTIEPFPNGIRADHQSFVEYGFDGILTEQYDYDENYTENIQHTQNDTSNHINWDYLTKITKLFLAVAVEFACTPLELQVIITKPYQGYFYFFNHPILSLDFWKENYHGLQGTTFILGATWLNFDVIASNDIKYFVFCIDGNVEDWQGDTGQNHDWKIQRMFYPLFGRHSVEVYAYDTLGNIAFDETNIVISLMIPKVFP